MEYRKLGNLEIATIGLGTLRTFDVTSDEDIVVRSQIVDNCLANDINFIDCASAYGNAEKIVGTTTQGRRDKFYMATKVRTEGKEAGEAKIARSIELFQTDHIDLYQIHTMIDWKTHLPTLEALKAEAKIGMIGVTAMVDEAYPEIVGLMKTERIETVQIPYNVMDREVEKELLPTVEELGTGVLVMESLKKGRYVKDPKSQPDLTPLAEYGIEAWAKAL